LAAQPAFSATTDSFIRKKAPVSVVVIDPGHGGSDTGAVGPGGAKEKDITLRVAKRLAARLREMLHCRVLLTRTDDRFVPLEQRSAMANRVGADVFISIHVNSAPSRSASGLETFFLSYEASDEEALKLAHLENGFDPGTAGIDSALPDDLKVTLLDLVETAAHHESSTLAESVHTSMIALTNRGDRGVKQAPFVVLSGAVMPAILIELGFISNRAEGRWLLSEKGMDDISRSIATGVVEFKERMTGGFETVGFRQTQ